MGLSLGVEPPPAAACLADASKSREVGDLNGISAGGRDHQTERMRRIREASEKFPGAARRSRLARSRQGHLGSGPCASDPPAETSPSSVPSSEPSIQMS